MNDLLKININNRDYSSWNIINIETKETIESISIKPINEKLFSKDIFSFSENQQIIIHESPIKNKKEIPGVLILEENKTFGRTKNKKRLFYKCIPDDKQLPIFLVPYEIRLLFSKVQLNRFVTFRYESWDDTHPYGVLVQNLGTVDQLEIYYEYQLYCKNLHTSITPLIKKTVEQIENLSSQSNGLPQTSLECNRNVTPNGSTFLQTPIINKANRQGSNVVQNINEENLFKKIVENPDFIIEDIRKKNNIFSIDPEGCTDIDDAMSIEYIKEENIYEISIYIANVFFWLETCDLWEYLTDRISTIYMPDKKRPMLPNVLSDNLCSLQKDRDRFAFTMVIKVDIKGGINDVKIKNTLIHVNYNYIYEEPNLIKNKDYIDLKEITQKIDHTVKDSHDVVTFWMIFMNSKCGELMRDKKKGIFRSSVFSNSNNNTCLTGFLNSNGLERITDDTRRFLTMWKNVSGQYILYEEGCNLSHESLGLQTYVHITSPIRRLVDTINQMIIMKDYNLIKKINNKGEQLIDKWFSKIETLNNIMKSIRKVQSECELLSYCFREPVNTQREYKGIIIEKKKKENDMFSYIIYLEELKMISKIVIKEDLKEYLECLFKIFLFEDEYKKEKKISIEKSIIL